jgi:hypothetical protein
MNEKIKLYFIIIISFIIFYIDIINDICVNNNTNNISIIFILLIHHFIVSFVLFGWIFNNIYILKMQLVLIISVCINQIVLYFLSNYIYNVKSNYCIITLIKNKLCNQKLNTPFKSILYYLNINKIVAIIIVLFISILKFYLLKKIN